MSLKHSELQDSKDDKVNKNNLFKVLKLLLEYKYLVLVATIIIIFIKIIEISIPFLIKEGITIISNNDYSSLSFLCIITIILIFIRFIASFSQVYLTNKIGLTLVKNLRLKLFSHILDLKQSFFDQHKVGRLVTRVVNDVDVINSMFSSGILTIIGDIFLLVGILIVSFYVDYRLALISTFSFPLLLFITILFHKASKTAYYNLRQKLSILNGYINETIMGYKVIQLFNHEEKSNKEFINYNHDYYDVFLQTVKIYSIYFPSIEVISTVSKISILLYGAYGIYNGFVGLPELIMFMLYSPMFYRPIRELAEKYNILQEASAATLRIYEVLENKERIDFPFNTNILEINNCNIVFDNVSFYYTEGNNILNNISFKIDTNDKVAFVGLTGSGKTTLINLLCRLYEPQSGNIYINNKDIRRFSKEELYSIINVVSQELYLFTASLYDNISLFSNDMSKSYIEESIHNKQILSIFDRINNNIEHKILERGQNISAGEKQLIAITRVLVNNPKIIILDEATSNIDSETEELIQLLLSRIFSHKTGIYIAHRLSTIKLADKIMVIHKGNIHETGTHDELISNNTIYRKLYQIALLN